MEDGSEVEEKRGSYAPGVLGSVEVGVSVSAPREKRETFFFGGSGAGDGVGCICSAGVLGVALPLAWTAGKVFFFLTGFRDTDSGLNISGFPTNLTSSAGCWPSGMLGPFVDPES